MRKVVQIDPERCDGCGECIPSCAEGAIRIVDGRARLVEDALCDGLGACLGSCPRDAITIVEREAAPFDAAVVAARRASSQQRAAAAPASCPGSRTISFGPRAAAAGEPGSRECSQLASWPVQLHLVPPTAPFLRGADLLLVADCVPFACASFHPQILRRRPVVIGCPKLDDVEAYAAKLAAIVSHARPSRLTVVVMEVPCCGGLLRLAEHATARAEHPPPIEALVVSVRGEVRDVDGVRGIVGAGCASRASQSSGSGSM